GGGRFRGGVKQPPRREQRGRPAAAAEEADGGGGQGAQGVGRHHSARSGPARAAFPNRARRAMWAPVVRLLPRTSRLSSRARWGDSASARAAASLRRLPARSRRTSAARGGGPARLAAPVGPGWGRGRRSPRREGGARGSSTPAR